MSFFKKIASDAVIFREKKKKTKAKKDSKTKDTFSSNTGEKNFSEGGNYMHFKNCNGVHIGNSFSFTATNVINKNNNEKNDSAYNSRNNVEEYFSSIEEANMAHFLIVSENMNSNGLNKLGLIFGFSDEQLDAFSSEEEGILNLLMAWKDAETRQATIGRLMQCLWEAQEFDAAKKLSEYLRKRDV